MKEADKPSNESKRLELLKSLNLLDSPIEERFERITRIVCRSLDVPISAVSLVDQDRQWFKSIQGIDVSETPRSVAFCSHAILEDEPFIIEDATEDPRFSGNPLVTDDPNIRFYAGIPLKLKDNLRIGTLCAIDNKPREISEEQLDTLEDLAEMVKSEMKSVKLSEAHKELINELEQTERAALLDSLTRLWNRCGGEKLLQREWERSIREEIPLSLVMADIDYFKKVNDNFGHDVGDDVLRHFSRTLLKGIRPSDTAVRWGGEEFLIIVPGCDEEGLKSTLDRLLSSIHTSKGETVSPTASLGAHCVFPHQCGLQWQDVLKVADDALYAAKEQGRDRYIIK